MSMPSFLMVSKELKFVSRLHSVFMIMGGLWQSVCDFSACLAICCKILAFRRLVTSPSTDFLSKAFGKASATLCSRDLHRRGHPKGLPHFFFPPPCSISLTRVSEHTPWLRSFFYWFSPRHSLTHWQETTTTKPACLAKWPFYHLILSGSIHHRWMTERKILEGRDHTYP